MAAERIVGVDFGTSTSVIRVKRYENGEPIGEVLETKEVVFGGNGAMVPTLVLKKDDQPSVCYFGYEARQKKKQFTNFHSFKMDLESDDPQLQARARTLTEEFYGFLAKQYKSQSEGGHLGSADDKERTIISYPVKWSEQTKAFMLATAKKAGFPNVSGMDEAQAAIRAVTVMSTDYLQSHGLLKAGETSNILLIDMGAGTTDLVLARHTPGAQGKTEVVSTWPKSGGIQFGGREVDGLLRLFFEKLPGDAEPEQIRRILDRVGVEKFKSWKEETVSPALRNRDSVRDFAAFDERMWDADLDLEYCLDRSAFEECLADYLKQFPALVNGCLQDAGMSGSEVDLAIVTGGHSQWYFVRDMLAGLLPQFGALELTKLQAEPARIVPVSRPQETVALGLAYSGLRTQLPEPVETETQKQEAPVQAAEPPVIAEESTPEPAEMFKMELDPQNKAFRLSGDKTVAIGTILQGSLKLEDWVYLWGVPGVSRGVQVKNLALHHESRNVTQAREGDCIAILLPGVSPEEVNRSSCIAGCAEVLAETPTPQTAGETGAETTADLVPESMVYDFFGSYTGKVSRPLTPLAEEKLRANFKLEPEEKILASWDATLFGIYKNGAAITQKGIYCRQILTDTAFYPWQEFVSKPLLMDEKNGNIYSMEKDGTKDKCYGYFFVQDVPEAFALYTALQEYLQEACGLAVTQAVHMGEVSAQNTSERVFTLAEGKSIMGAVRVAESFFQTKEMETQFFRKDAYYIVQARTKSGELKQFVGMDKAVEIRIKELEEQRVSLEVGGAKWLDKAAGLLVSWFVLWPLAITSGVGIYEQSKIVNEARRVMENYFTSNQTH